MSWVGVNADQVVAFIVWWSLVGKDVPPHEVTHDEKLRPCGDHGQSEEFSFLLAHDCWIISVMYAQPLVAVPQLLVRLPPDHQTSM